MTVKTSCKCSNCYYEFEIRKNDIKKRRCPNCGKTIEALSKTIFLVTEMVDILKISAYGLKARQIKSQLMKRGFETNDINSQKIAVTIKQYPHIFEEIKCKGGFRWGLRCKNKV